MIFITQEVFLFLGENCPIVYFPFLLEEKEEGRTLFKIFILFQTLIFGEMKWPI